jgi:hypothetical protein
MENTQVNTRMVVESYDEGSDTFTCRIEDPSYEYAPFTIPAILIPSLTGHWGEPYAFVGMTFELDYPGIPVKLIPVRG